MYIPLYFQSIINEDTFIMWKFSYKTKEKSDQNISLSFNLAGAITLKFTFLIFYQL